MQKYEKVSNNMAEDIVFGVVDFFYPDFSWGKFGIFRIIFIFVLLIFNNLKMKNYGE